MKKIYKNIKSIYDRDIKCLAVLLSLLFGLYACKEQGRFEIGYDDSVPPSAPEFISYKPLYGGARLFYKIPSDKDLLSIDATYLNPEGKKVWFSISYFTDSLDVYGFNDSLTHVVELYAVDRAGNKSATVSIPVVPLEPAYSRVANSVTVKPGFSSFFVDWINELEQTVNVYVEFSYSQQGQTMEHRLIYTSSLATERWFIRDLDISGPIKIRARVEDLYGNITEYRDKGEIRLLHDELIPKDKWYLPDPNDSIGGVPMAYLQMGEARKTLLIDGKIDDGVNVNYTHTNWYGRTGYTKDGNVPWNVMIDLGDEYEISRIVTHQRYYTGDNPTTGRGTYYQGENVGIYNMYIMDANTGEWEYVSQHKILYPNGLSDIEYMQLGRAGDMAYLYPDDPQFSKPTRWFRYEALFGFKDNYTNQSDVNCMSEITLYGRKTGN
jgi:hypothetical protein